MNAQIMFIINKIVTRWINRNIETRGIRVNDLFEDIKDAVILYNLCEVFKDFNL